MNTSFFALAGLGLLLGFRHAFEPEQHDGPHDDADAQAVTDGPRDPQPAGIEQLALARGEGRDRGQMIGLQLPRRLWPAADFLVGLLLIGLGASVLVRYVRGRWHLHVHAHDGGPHLHLHSHAHDAAHAHAHPQGDARRSLGFGLLHGLAGSAAILVLLVAAAPTRTAQLTYFLAFAAGTMLGML